MQLPDEGWYSLKVGPIVGTVARDLVSAAW
jgi:hypothetical protein